MPRSLCLLLALALALSLLWSFNSAPDDTTPPSTGAPAHQRIPLPAGTLNVPPPSINQTDNDDSPSATSTTAQAPTLITGQFQVDRRPRIDVWIAPVNAHDVPTLNLAINIAKGTWRPRGYFRAEVRERGRYLLFAEHQDYLPYSRMIELKGVPINLGDIHLDQGLTITGTVALNGTLMNRAVVAYGPSRPHVPGRPDCNWEDGVLKHGRRHAAPRAGGTRFKLAGLHEGTLTIALVSIGRLTEVDSIPASLRRQLVTVQDGRMFHLDVAAARLDVDFEDAAANTPWDPAVVLHVDGKEVPGLRDDDGYQRESFWVSPASTVRLEARWPTGYVERRQVDIGAPSTKQTISLRGPPDTGQSLSIRIQTNEGETVTAGIANVHLVKASKAIELQVGEWDHWNNRHFMVDAHGRFRIRCLLPGTYRLVFRALRRHNEETNQDLVDFEQRVVVVSGAHTELEFRAQQGGLVHFVIFGPDGKRVGGHLRVFDDKGDSVRMTLWFRERACTSSSSGVRGHEFRTGSNWLDDALPPGTYTLKARQSSEPWTETTFPVQPGERTTVTLALNSPSPKAGNDTK